MPSKDVTEIPQGRVISRYQWNPVIVRFHVVLEEFVSVISSIVHCTLPGAYPLFVKSTFRIFPCYLKVVGEEQTRRMRVARPLGTPLSVWGG
jgi:hypothetical protein